MDGLQLLLAKVVVDGYRLLVVVGTTVDDDTLTTVVAHHITVLLQGINLKTLYTNHRRLVFYLDFLDATLILQTVQGCNDIDLLRLVRLLRQLEVRILRDGDNLRHVVNIHTLLLVEPLPKDFPTPSRA